MSKPKTVFLKSIDHTWSINLSSGNFSIQSSVTSNSKPGLSPRNPRNCFIYRRPELSILSKSLTPMSCRTVQCLGIKEAWLWCVLSSLPQAHAWMDGCLCISSQLSISLMQLNYVTIILSLHLLDKSWGCLTYLTLVLGLSNYQGRRHWPELDPLMSCHMSI